MERLYGVENIGISLYNKRRYAEAARQFESALLPMQNLASRRSRQSDVQERVVHRPRVASGRTDDPWAELDARNQVRAQRQVSLLNQAVAGGASPSAAFRQPGDASPRHQGLRGCCSRGGGNRIAALRSCAPPVEPCRSPHSCRADKYLLAKPCCQCAGSNLPKTLRSLRAGATRQYRRRQKHVR